MAIRSTSVKPYKISYGSVAMTEMVTEIVQQLARSTSYDGDMFELYNMGGETKYFQAGNKKRSIAFLNASPVAYRTRKAEDVFGISADVIVLPEQTNDEFVPILSPEGVQVATYSMKYNEMYILTDITSLPVEQAKVIFEALMTHFRVEILDKRDLETSWMHSPIKDQLIARFKKRIEDQNARTIRDDTDRLRDYESRIVNYQRDAKNAHDNIILLRNRLSQASKVSVDAQNKVVAELDAIITHERVSDLRIEDGIIVISIDDIFAHDKKDRRFYIGNFKVRIKLDTSEVNFFGDNPRRSYWTAQDPHPHVNGNDGRACLGNVSQTIAELCSYNELYALFLTCLDFLENANIEDSAGQNVTNWDQVDESGKVINGGGSSSHDWTCDRCGDGQDEDDEEYIVMTEYHGDGDVGGDQTWCEHCRENHGTYNDLLEEVLTESVNTMVEEYYEEDED